MIALAAKRNVKKTDDLIDVWQGVPFPNYGEPFIYEYRVNGEPLKIESARGKLAVFPEIIDNKLFDGLFVNSSKTNYTPTFYINETLQSLYAAYKILFNGELLYVLGLVVDGVKRYFDTSFLVATQDYVPNYSVSGLEENNAQYDGISLFGLEINRHIVVPDKSLVLALPSNTALSLRYEFGEEEFIQDGDYALIVKKPIGYTVIPSLPKVELPCKGILELNFI